MREAARPTQIPLTLAQLPKIGDVFRSIERSSFDTKRWTLKQRQVFHNIQTCRTSLKGGHLWRCEACDHEVPLYNSCLDRHCPQCQTRAGYNWAEKKMNELLNVPYFHVVFTLPHVLNPIVAFNPNLLGLLFRAVSNTLLLFGQDPQYLGGEVGVLAILHTWDQKLHRHIHLHCIVPGGALSPDGTTWIHAKHEKFLFPVHALGKTFRRLFWHGSKILDASRQDDPVRRIKRKFKGLSDLLDRDLKLPGNLASLKESRNRNQLENQMYKHRWVVYAKRPFGGPNQVLKYLSRYTHRVAISNTRLVSHANGAVQFTWRDRRQKRRRLLTLPVHEFVCRFLQHVLPKGFVKIRSYGFLASRKKKKRVAQIRQLVGSVELDLQPEEEAKITPLELETATAEESSRICPRCKKPTLKQTFVIPARQQVPPQLTSPWNTS